MTTKRDKSFPAGSIGRGHGALSLTRTSSHETLSAHPLLSPNHSTTSLLPASLQPASPESHQSSTSGAPNTSGLQRTYVPYTPRQRVVTTSTTTGTAHPSVSASPQQHHGDATATSKLQLMNLKAAAQNVGLDTASIGWAILEKLVFESDHGAEWVEIWSTVTTGKGTLLLPLEKASASEKVTPDFVKDHIILCEGSSRDNAPIITLSGLRGVLHGETLILRSSIHPTSKQFQNILAPTTRPAALASLPPLPNLSHPHSYPSFTFPAHTSSLPLPPRAAGPPPLPPRPSARPSSSQGATSRISNPFASLFGKPTTPLPPPPPTSTTPPPAPDPDHVVDVSAFAIDRRIVRKDVGKEMNRALRNEVKESLSGITTWVVDRVHDFTLNLYPLVKSPRHSSQSAAAPYVVNDFAEASEETAEKLQDFYGMLEQDLRLGGTPFLGRRREEQAEDDEKRIQEKVESEAKIREILETVERTICSLFYDRLFLQPTSDDASHDEALSSRVAALNMLDLGLEHLDVHVGDAGPQVELVVKACGETLMQLDVACRTPADNAAILVAAHKAIVNGLSQLPPIRLKSEAESKEQKKQQTPKANFVLQSTDTPPQNPAPLPLTSEIESPIDPDSNTIKPLAITLSSPSRPNSPLLTLSPPAEATPVSGDILLPLIIFSVVKSNPPHLVSHLLYTQRFRNQSIGGEESYCLINLMAVAEFLENVDLGALGLGDSDKVVSAADLTPIPINRSPKSADMPLGPSDGIPGSLRGRVEQQVDAIAGSANKVISGVVDSSFGILRSLLPNSPDATSPPVEGAQAAAPWNAMRPGFGLLRRESGFSIASIAASLPGGGVIRGNTKSMEEVGQPLLAVSRPGSIKSLHVGVPDDDSPSEESSNEDGEDDEDDEEEQDGDANPDGVEHDTRSIRSFESMMSGKKTRDRRGAAGRKSLTDRLAHMSGLAGLKGSPPPSRRSSLLPPGPSNNTNRFDTPVSSRPTSPVALRLAPPNSRFMECSEADIKVSEVPELLREYKRLAEGLRAMGGFDE